MLAESRRYTFEDPRADYIALRDELRHLLADESDRIANVANATALLHHALPDLNWCGVYFMQESGLVVGPFQGKPACVRIALGKGVCGTAAAQRQTIVVPDVHAFPGHIACDAASRSEIVVPLLAPDGALLGVLDLDSPRLARFGEEDRRGLEAICAVLVEALGRSGNSA